MQKVTKFFKENFGGVVERKGLGQVLLDEKGVKDSISHGIGSLKSAVFTAVPDIIKNGQIIDIQKNWKGRGKDTYVIAAPIKIGDEGHVGIVVVTKSKSNNRFYLHEVTTQKNLQDGLLSKTGALPNSRTNNGGLAKILKNILEAKENSSKVLDKNGHPLVVYHGTAADFVQFDPARATDAEGRKRKMGWGANKFYFTESAMAAGVSAEFAQQTGRGDAPNIMPVFLNIRKPISAEDYMGRVHQLTEQGISRDKAIEQVDKKIKEEGYDGIIDEISGGMAVFSPTQIKSATANQGTFNRNWSCLSVRAPRS